MDKIIEKVNGWRVKSFTLVELLVVIGILGILAGVLFLSIAPAEQAKKGRDAQRKSDLSQIRLAAEKYYEDTKRYPASTSDYMIQSGNWGKPWQPYMAKVPKDPLPTNLNYAYYASSDGQSYQLYAALERKDDPQACAGGCGPNGNYSYGITSPNIALAKIIVTPTPGPTAALTSPPTPILTFTPTPTPTSILTSTPTPTATPTPTPTPTSILTSTPTLTSILTSTPTPTATPTPMLCINGYKDFDKDGYGAGPFGCYTSFSSYNIVSNNSDCYDGNAQAYPGQSIYFSVNRGDGSYDYDCDGIQSKDPKKNCLLTISSSCTTTRGYPGYNTSIPSCGETGNFKECQGFDDSKCSNGGLSSSSCTSRCPQIDPNTGISYVGWKANNSSQITIECR